MKLFLSFFVIAMAVQTFAHDDHNWLYDNFGSTNCVPGSLDISWDMGSSNPVCIDIRPKEGNFSEAWYFCKSSRKRFCTIEELMASTAYQDEMI